MGRLCPAQQLAEVIIYARHPKIRLTLKRLAQIMDTVRVITRELDDRENEVLGLIEGIEDLIAGHGYGGGARDTALHLDKAQSSTLV